MKFKFTTKKTVILIIALVILFIPTYIAIYSARSTNASPVTPDGKTSVLSTLTVKDPNQNATVIEEDSSATGDWVLFESMIKNASQINELPDTVDKDGNMLLCTYSTVTVTENADGSITESDPVTKSYSFYMSTDTSACYFMDPEKKSFCIDSKDAASFLSNTLANYLYKSAVIPEFTFLGKKITAENLTWNYLAAGNTYKTIEQTSEGSESFDYESGTELSWSFTTAPTACMVKLTDSSGKSLYDAQLSGLSKVSLEKNTVLSFEIKASWEKTDNCEYYGEAVYRFNADLSAPAVFSLASDTIYGGEFAVVSALNIKDTSKISFRSVPALPSDPIFGATGDSVTALIPVSYGLTVGSASGPAEYTLIFTYGNVEQTFTLKVNDYRYGYKTSSYQISANLVNTNYSEVQVSAYNKLVSEICSYESSSTALFSGTFLNYETKGVLETKGATLVSGFGRFIKINNSSEKSFQHTGVDFAVTSTEKIDVPAMNSGTVCYAGTDSVLGNFVVIDHGCGLRSWYAHLTDISVKAGDSVQTGAAVGKTCAKGTSGFTVEGRIHVGITIGNQAVAPYSLWESGVQLPEFY